MFSETTDRPLSSTSVNNFGGAEAAENMRTFQRGSASPVVDVSPNKKAPELGGGARGNDMDAVTGPCARLLLRRSAVSFPEAPIFDRPARLRPRQPRCRALRSVPQHYYAADGHHGPRRDVSNWPQSGIVLDAFL